MDVGGEKKTEKIKHIYGEVGVLDPQIFFLINFAQNIYCLNKVVEEYP